MAEKKTKKVKIPKPITAHYCKAMCKEIDDYTENRGLKMQELHKVFVHSVWNMNELSSAEICALHADLIRKADSQDALVILLKH